MTSTTDSIRLYCDRLYKVFSTIAPVGQPEDQLKAPTVDLLAAVGDRFSLDVVSETEARVADLGGRPDIAVRVGGLIVGYIELKRPGMQCRPDRFKKRSRDGKQWAKFSALPNIIYTNGTDWYLFRDGQFAASVRLPDIITDGPDTLAETDARDLRRLLNHFVRWQPIVPKNPREVARLLAPICRLLREEVAAAVKEPQSNLSALATEWRNLLFPTADDGQFADAYAQTLTYGLLLARVEGSDGADLASAAHQLQNKHLLLARAIQVLGDSQVRKEIGLAIEILERVIGAVDATVLGRTRGRRDPWAYFYEDFLAAYDPALRNNRGVYYTPTPVVRAQVNIVHDLLKTRMMQMGGLANPSVVVLDPAAGTGAYTTAVIEKALGEVEDTFGAGAVPGRASSLAENVAAFEILVGPYTVCQLRVSAAINSAGGRLPNRGASVYLADALTSPWTPPSSGAQHGLFTKPLAREHEEATRIKRDVNVWVCIGNPPYDRQMRRSAKEQLKGGWVRFGDQTNKPDTPPLLEDYRAPAIDAGQSANLKGLYNDYVYFWRWATWKVFEARRQPGIVCFITVSSFLRGPGFVGMREHPRRTADEIWVLDLEGDSRGPRKTQNVFAIQTGVAITIVLRSGAPHEDRPARVHYHRITGTRREKLDFLDGINSIEDAGPFEECSSGFRAPFLPPRQGDFFAWPALEHLLPWRHSGIQAKRTWPIGESQKLLQRRWETLLSLGEQERRTAMVETDRTIHSTPKMYRSSQRHDSLASLAPEAPPPIAEPIAFRCLDRQWLLFDHRLVDRMRDSLWTTRSPEQVYFTTLYGSTLSNGPALFASRDVPDMHHFRGSYGGKDVHPLFRGPGPTAPNVTSGLLDALSAALGKSISASKLGSYIYGVLCNPAYTETFEDDLDYQDIRVPISKDPELFSEVVRVGEELLNLHLNGTVSGAARCTKPVPETAEDYPQEFRYEEETKELHIGKGTFGPIAPEVWNYRVSDYEVVGRWVQARLPAGYGRASSPLDGIRPSRWTFEFTQDLLRVLWTVEHSVRLHMLQGPLLARVTSGPCFAAKDLPSPTKPEQKAPPVPREAPTPLLDRIEPSSA